VTPRFSDDSRERVRDAVDMVALVSSRVELRRSGVNSYFGRCPFHDERTPSFHVRPQEKHYHCFGCGESGDPFSFVMATEGLDFPAAMESLAQRFGVELEVVDEDPQAAARRRRRERLHELLDRAASYYQRVLADSGEAAGARAYLEQRGLEKATLEAFRVGYAPSAWDRMLLASRRAGFTEEELRAAGLAQLSQRERGRLYDRFRARIMFPLADARGRVVGFGARATREGQQPKYLNTSDGEIYHKGSQLFGLDVARAPAAREGSVVLVEGYTDVLAMHQAGIENAVGLMGTALTEEQAGELRRLAPVVALALDADSAGREAMARAGRVCAGRGLELRVVPLPGGSDPADLIAAEGPEAMRERVGDSVPFVSFLVDRALDAANTTSAEGKDAALTELRPLLGGMAPSMLREDLVRRVAGRLDLSGQMVDALLRGAPPRANGRAAPGGAPPAVALDRREQTEQAFLALCIALADHGGREALEAVDAERHFTSPLTRRAAALLAGHLDDPLAAVPEDDPDLGALVAALIFRFDGDEPAAPRTLELEGLQLEKLRLDRALAGARESEPGLVPGLAAEREELLRRIDAVTEAIDHEAR